MRSLNGPYDEITISSRYFWATGSSLKTGHTAWIRKPFKKSWETVSNRFASNQTYITEVLAVRLEHLSGPIDSHQITRTPYTELGPTAIPYIGIELFVNYTGNLLADSIHKCQNRSLYSGPLYDATYWALKAKLINSNYSIRLLFTTNYIRKVERLIFFCYFRN